MKLDVQRRIAARILKCAPKRIWFDPGRLEEIKEAITKADMRGLILDKAVQEKPKRGISRFHARHIKNQKKKGRQKGSGSRKGRLHARLKAKDSWMNKIRLQRWYLAELKQQNKSDSKTYRDLYRKAKGGQFRSLRHLKLVLSERKLI